MSHDVAILIVTYNSEQQIGACLRSVFAQRDHVSQQVIVLDNASQDGTVALLRRDFPQVELLLPSRNLGFAAGVNAAAQKANAPFLLLLNPDTEILDHAVDVIVDFARAHPAHGLYGGRTLKPDGALEPSSCWGLPTLWSLAMFALGLSTLFPRHRLFDPESLGPWPRDTVREIGVITGCFLLATREAWQKLQGLDERYFMYGEDVDLALRAHRAGYRPVICPAARLIHEVGKSSSKPIDKMLLLYRGKAQLVRTHWQGLSQAFARNLLLLGVALRALLSRATRPGPNSHSAHRWPQLWAQRETWIGGFETTPAPNFLPTPIQSAQP